MSRKTCQHPVDCDFEDEKHEYCTWINTESSDENVQWDIYSPLTCDPNGLKLNYFKQYYYKNVLCVSIFSSKKLNLRIWSCLR